MKNLKRGHAGSSIKGSLIGGSAKPMLTGKKKSSSSSLPDSEDSLALSMHNPNKSRKKKKKGKPENNVDGGINRTIRFQKRDEKMGAGILELVGPA
jgi:hypothetical protein